MALGRRFRWWQRLPRRKWRLVLSVDEADEVPEHCRIVLPFWLVRQTCRNGSLLTVRAGRDTG